MRPSDPTRKQRMSVLRVFTEQFSAALATSYECSTTDHTIMQAGAHSKHLQVLRNLLDLLLKLYSERRDPAWDRKDYTLTFNKKSADAGRQFCEIIMGMLNVRDNAPAEELDLDNWDFGSVIARAWEFLHEGTGQEHATKDDVNQTCKDTFPEHFNSIMGGPYKDGDGGDKVGEPVNLIEGKCNSCEDDLHRITECFRCLKALCRQCALNSGRPEGQTFQHPTVIVDGVEETNESIWVLMTESEVLCRKCQSDTQRACYDRLRKQQQQALERQQAPKDDKKSLKDAQKKANKFERDNLQLRMRLKEVEDRDQSFDEAVASKVAEGTAEIEKKDREIAALKAAMAALTSSMASPASGPSEGEQLKNLEGQVAHYAHLVESLRQELATANAKVQHYENAEHGAAEGGSAPQGGSARLQPAALVGQGAAAGLGNLQPGESRHFAQYSCRMGNAVEAGQIDPSTGVQYCEPSPPCHVCGEGFHCKQYAFCDHCDPIRNSSMHKKQRRNPAY